MSLAACRSMGGLLQQIAQCRFQHGRTGDFPLFPAPHGLGCFANVFGNLALSEPVAGLPQQLQWLCMGHALSFLGTLRDIMTH